MGDKFRVLLVCTGNSCRSQIAEGLVRHFMGDRIDVESAGVMPCFVHPCAIEVLSELGIDISNQRSKHVDEFDGEDFDLVITLCSFAKEVCGIFPWAKEQAHMELEDPINASGSWGDRLEAYRRTCDEIRAAILPFIEERYKVWRLK